MPASTQDLDGRLASIRAEVDRALELYLPVGSGCPPRLHEAMRYSLLAPGKRLRPVLTVLAVEACGGSRAMALPAAAALEMVHTYSLIHDDLPAMDNDDLRRGRPTNHKVYGDALAILAGDALLTLAFEVLATHVQPHDLAGRCCGVLARAAGCQALVGGQADDLAAESQPLPASQAESLAQLQAIHARKTGAMFCAALELGGVIGGAGLTRLDQLARYGRSLGLAFQITDDLLDVEGSEAILGKRVGKDTQRGKLTFPGVLGIEESRRRAAAEVQSACGALTGWGSPALPLVELARRVLERDC